VLNVTEPVDCFGNLQGTPNYRNENMLVGDTLRFVDGRCIDDMPFEFVKDVLWGAPNTIVRLRLTRGKPRGPGSPMQPGTRLQPGDLYEVTVRRHAMVTAEGIAALHNSNISERAQKISGWGGSPLAHKPEEPNIPARRSESPDLVTADPPSPKYDAWDESEQLGRRNATLDAFLY